jgi:hypothetical protein
MMPHHEDLLQRKYRRTFQRAPRQPPPYDALVRLLSDARFLPLGPEAG